MTAVCRRLAVTAVVGALAIALPAAGPASPAAHAGIEAVPTGSSVRLRAWFSPERLGGSTTVHVALRIAPPSGRPAIPLTELKLFYPAGLGFGTSELGLQTCQPARLRQRGLAGCPANSFMGHGEALVQVPFGPRTVSERVSVAIVSRPVTEGHAGLLFLARGSFPVIADLVFGALLLPSGERFGDLIDVRLPLVPTVPEGPDVALVGLNTAIGPQGITYVENIKGRTVSFHPRGILLPRRCPPGGFRFDARLAFQDGSRSTARASVPCAGR